MKTLSKVVLAAFAAMTLVSAAARADDNHLRQGGPGVVISQDAQVSQDAQTK